MIWRFKVCNYFKEFFGVVFSCVVGFFVDNYICEVFSVDFSLVFIILFFEFMFVVFFFGLFEDGKCFSKEFLVLDDIDVVFIVVFGFLLGK